MFKTIFLCQSSRTSAVRKILANSNAHGMFICVVFADIDRLNPLNWNELNFVNKIICDRLQMF